MIKYVGRNYGGFLGEYGVKGHLVMSESSLYDESRAFVSWGREVGKYFMVERVLKHGCVVSPWMFFHRVVKGVNERGMGRGRKLRDGSERVSLRRRVVEWDLKLMVVNVICWWFRKDERVSCGELRVRGEIIQEVCVFKNSVVTTSADGDMGKKWPKG